MCSVYARAGEENETKQQNVLGTKYLGKIELVGSAAEKQVYVVVFE